MESIATAAEQKAVARRDSSAEESEWLAESRRKREKKKKVAEVLQGRRMIQMSGGGQVGHLSPGRSQSCTGTPAGKQWETRR